MSAFKKVSAVAGAGAIVASAFVPSVAFADPSNDSTPVTDVQASIQIKKDLVTNDNINVAGDVYTFNITPDKCENGKPATDTACRAVEDYPALTSNTVTATFAAGEKTQTVGLPLPAESAYQKAGIYVWTVTEAQSGALDPHVVDYSDASYRVKAYVVGNATDGFTYKAVTIAQDAKDLSTDDVTTGNNKKDKMTFTNIYEDVTTFAVEKKVINNAGLPEAENYEFTVEFGWPENFNGTTRTGNKPAVEVGGGATDGNCVANDTDKKTTCRFKLAKDATASFTNVPVGATYTVAETRPDDAKWDIKSISSENGKVPAAGASSTVTNEYDDVTPTGIALAAAPYVLMIGLPILAVGGYVGLRRKMQA